MKDALGREFADPIPSGSAEYMGMTLRDYFASFSISTATLAAREMSVHAVVPSASTIASIAYQIADAMLKERAK